MAPRYKPPFHKNKPTQRYPPTPTRTKIHPHTESDAPKPPFFLKRQSARTAYSPCASQAQAPDACADSLVGVQQVLGPLLVGLTPAIGLGLLGRREQPLLRQRLRPPQQLPGAVGVSSRVENLGQRYRDFLSSSRNRKGGGVNNGVFSWRSPKTEDFHESAETSKRKTGEQGGPPVRPCKLMPFHLHLYHGRESGARMERNSHPHARRSSDTGRETDIYVYFKIHSYISSIQNTERSGSETKTTSAEHLEGRAERTAGPEGTLRPPIVDSKPGPTPVAPVLLLLLCPFVSPGLRRYPAALGTTATTSYFSPNEIDKTGLWGRRSLKQTQTLIFSTERARRALCPFSHALSFQGGGQNSTELMHTCFWAAASSHRLVMRLSRSKRSVA